MMTIQVVPDRFKTQQEAVAAKAKLAPTFRHVRRPTRGIVLKDETFATLRVATGTGGSIPLIDAGSKFVDGTGLPLTVNGKRATDIYSNFLLQQVNEERMEKQQILETFGEPYIFLFGERARVISVSGILLNTFDFNWEAEWQENYDRYLRGTRCVENDARVYLAYDNTLVSGYIIGTSWAKNAEQPNFVNFQFQLFVANYTNFSKIGNPDAHPPSWRESNVPVTQQSLQAFRPELLTSVGDQFPGGDTQKKTLSQGIIESGLAQINAAWSSVSQIVDNTLSSASNALNGTTVRVPYGWQGATVFDDDDRVSQVDVKFNTSLKYTTFDRNDDEYVGTTSHYGTAGNENGSSRVNFEDPKKALQYNQDMVESAQDAWAEAGLAVPTPELGSVSSFLVGKNLGLLVAGATDAWRTQAAPPVPVVQLVNLNALQPGFGRAGAAGNED